MGYPVHGPNAGTEKASANPITDVPWFVTQARDACYEGHRVIAWQINGLLTHRQVPRHVRADPARGDDSLARAVARFREALPGLRTLSPLPADDAAICPWSLGRVNGRENPPLCIGLTPECQEILPRCLELLEGRSWSGCDWETLIVDEIESHNRAWLDWLDRLTVPPNAPTIPHTQGAARQPASIDRILARGAKRTELLDQLLRVQDRFAPKRLRVVEALQRIEASIAEIVAAPGQMTPLELQESLADALVDMCQAAREGDFGSGIVHILDRDRECAGDNESLAIEVYQRGWVGNRHSVVELLGQLTRLPQRGDHFDQSTASQLGVWHAVRAMFNLIIPWPPAFNTVHFWHPDAVEAGRLQAELAQHTARTQLAGEPVATGLSLAMNTIPVRREVPHAEARAAPEAAPPTQVESKDVAAGTGAAEQVEPRTPSAPTQYLLNWREILDALGQKNNAENRRRVSQLNEQYEGPIIRPTKGGQPRVSKSALLDWWNGLEERFRESEQRQADTEASLQARHRFGKDGTVLPDISGHVQKRRNKSDR